MPFSQSALGDRLVYELTFNDYSRVIQATGAAGAAADAHTALRTSVWSLTWSFSQIWPE